MVATLTTQGVEYFTRTLLIGDVNGNQTLRLFTNNRDPQVGDTPAQYTECTQTGYVAVPLAPALWAGTTVNGIATYTYPSQVFELRATPTPQTVFGYYVTSPDGQRLLYAEKFPAPYTSPVTGGSLAVGLIWQDKQC